MATRIKIIPIRSRAPKPDARKIRRELEKAMRDSVSDGQRFIAKYPPQRLRKTGYRRTGTLKRSWSSKVTSGARRIEGVVGSNSGIAPYNRPVQGRRQVPAFRRAGWKGVDDLAKMLQDELNKRVQRVIDRIPS